MTTTTRVRGPYRVTTATRAAILASALEEFGTRGYDGASLRRIAERAGLSHPGLLHHFGSKEELLIAILSAREEEERALMRQDVYTVDGIIEVLTASLSRYQQTPSLARLWAGLSATASADPSHAGHDYVVRRYRLWTEELTGWLEQAKAVDEVRAEVDTRVAAVAVLALLQGLMAHLLADPELDVRPVLSASLDPLRELP